MKKGLILIELLVVIAIIAILAAILFPVFNSVRAAAKQSVCASNLKQLGTAMELYRNDFDDVSPIAASTLESPTNQESSLASYQRFNENRLSSWVPDYSVLQDPQNPLSPIAADWKSTGPTKGSLYPYVKNISVYVCPADPRPEKLLSYSLNGPIGSMPSSLTDRPSNLAEFVDEQATLNDGFFQATTDCVTTNHSGGTNLEFFDHHVKFVKGNVKEAHTNDCPNQVDMTLFCPTLPFTDGPYIRLCPAAED